MKIYLDDKRSIPQGFRGARNFQEFKALIQLAKDENITIEEISFDHDLGIHEPEGYEIVKWLAENYPEYVVGNTELHSHSSNSPGLKNIEKFIEFCKNHKEELLEMKKRPDTGVEFSRLK